MHISNLRTFGGNLIRFDPAVKVQAVDQERGIAGPALDVGQAPLSNKGADSLRSDAEVSGGLFDVEEPGHYVCGRHAGVVSPFRVGLPRHPSLI